MHILFNFVIMSELDVAEIWNAFKKIERKYSDALLLSEELIIEKY